MIDAIVAGGQTKHFSYPFIPWIETSKRIAVIGLETKKWHASILSAVQQDLSTIRVMTQATEEYRTYDGSSNKRGQFAGLMRNVESIFGEKPLWLNFFAFSYKTRSISRMKNPQLKNQLMNCSTVKLIEELTLAKPQVIIFVGSYYNRFDLIANALTTHRNRLRCGKYFSETWDNCLITRIPHPAAKSVPNKTTIIRDNLTHIARLWQESTSR